MNEIANIDVKEMTVEQLGADIRLLTAQAKRTLLDTGIQIGYRLQIAKEKVSGESFAEWVERETEFSKSSAYRFIQLYESYGKDQGSVFGIENAFPMLGKVSISNALRLLAVPEEERESFAAEVDAEHISARELDEAIKAREKAERLREEADELVEYAKEKNEALFEELKATSAELEKAEALNDGLQNALQIEKDKVKELESRPVEVAVQVDEKAVEAAAKEAREEAERKAKAERETLQKKLQEAEERARKAELAAEEGAEKARSASRDEAAAYLAEAEKAKAEAEALRKKLAASDGTVSAMNAYIQAALISINKAAELLNTVENAETKEKLKGAMRKLAQMIEAVAE